MNVAFHVMVISLLVLVSLWGFFFHSKKKHRLSLNLLKVSDIMFGNSPTALMPNCQPVFCSRLSLTSQMGCNCLINPMFVSFYAFYYGLFSLRAVSSADLPSLGEVLCQKHFCCLTSITSVRMLYCVLSQLDSNWVEEHYLPSLLAMPLQVHSSPFQWGCLAQCYMINTAMLSSVRERKAWQ